MGLLLLLAETKEQRLPSDRSPQVQTIHPSTSQPCTHTTPGTPSLICPSHPLHPTLAVTSPEALLCSPCLVTHPVRHLSFNLLCAAPVWINWSFGCQAGGFHLYVQTWPARQANAIHTPLLLWFTPSLSLRLSILLKTPTDGFSAVLKPCSWWRLYI